MKINVERLRTNIEDVISEGVVHGEEVDVTTQKVMDELEMLIKALEYYDAKETEENPF